LKIWNTNIFENQNQYNDNIIIKMRDLNNEGKLDDKKKMEKKILLTKLNNFIIESMTKAVENIFIR